MFREQWLNTRHHCGHHQYQTPHRHYHRHYKRHRVYDTPSAGKEKWGYIWVLYGYGTRCGRKFRLYPTELRKVISLPLLSHTTQKQEGEKRRKRRKKHALYLDCTPITIRAVKSSTPPPLRVLPDPKHEALSEHKMCCKLESLHHGLSPSLLFVSLSSYPRQF